MIFMSTNLTPIGNMGGMNPSPDPFPGQQPIPPAGARLKGLAASPAPGPIRGLAAQTSADGQGMPVPEAPALDTDAMNNQPYGPWPGGSRSVSGINAAPGPKQMTGPKADSRTISVGDPRSYERRVNPNRGPRVAIPVDTSGNFGQVNAPTSFGVPNQNMPMGVPTFGNIGAVSQQPKTNFG
jgi:hypothetical protein